MSRRRLAALLLVAAAAALAAVAVVATRSEDLTPAQQADRSCRLLPRVQSLVANNGSADDVLESVADARSLAVDASHGDSVWLPLAGAWQALEKGFETDDPEAARVGIDAVRAGCDQSIDLPAPPP